jgi:hypothetical protein
MNVHEASGGDKDRSIAVSDLKISYLSSTTQSIFELGFLERGHVSSPWGACGMTRILGRRVRRSFSTRPRVPVVITVYVLEMSRRSFLQFIIHRLSWNKYGRRSLSICHPYFNMWTLSKLEILLFSPTCIPLLWWFRHYSSWTDDGFCQLIKVQSPWTFN